MPNILRNLRINRVASVDKGAGEGVQVLLMKRDPQEGDEVVDKSLTFERKADGTTRLWHDDNTNAEVDAPQGAKKKPAGTTTKRDFSARARQHAASEGKAMPDGSFPIENEADLHNAVRLAGNAKNPAAARKHIISRAKAMGLTSALPDDWNVSKGASSVFHYGLDLLRKSVESLFEVTPADREALLAQTFEEFETHVQSEMTASGEEDPASTAAQDGNDTSGVNKGNDTMTEQEIAALTKKATDGEAAIAKAATLEAEVAFLKMSPAHQAFAKDFDAAKKAEWVKKDPKAKDEEMADCAKKATEQVPESVKKALAEAEDIRKSNEALLKRVADLESKDEAESLAKRATDIGLTATDATLLQKARKGDLESVKKLEDRIGALTAQVKEGGLFKEFGSAQTKGGSAYDQIQAKAEELRKTDSKLTSAQAFEKAYTDPVNKDLVTLYKREAKSVAA